MTPKRLLGMDDTQDTHLIPESPIPHQLHSHLSSVYREKRHYFSSSIFLLGHLLLGSKAFPVLSIRSAFPYDHHPVGLLSSGSTQDTCNLCSIRLQVFKVSTPAPGEISNSCPSDASISSPPTSLGALFWM